MPASLVPHLDCSISVLLYAVYALTTTSCLSRVDYVCDLFLLCIFDTILGTPVMQSKATTLILYLYWCLSDATTNIKHAVSSQNYRIYWIGHRLYITKYISVWIICWIMRLRELDKVHSWSKCYISTRNSLKRWNADKRLFKVNKYWTEIHILGKWLKCWIRKLHSEESGCVCVVRGGLQGLKSLIFMRILHTE